MLSQAEDRSVVIVSVGELPNLRDLLEEDEGYDLITAKVKEIHYMDGGYNFGCGDSDGSGWSPWLGSVDGCEGSAQFVQQHIPSSIKQVYNLNGD